MRWWLETTHGHVVHVRGWMAWNLLLAAIGPALAWALFVRRGRRGVGWWFGSAAFVAFLPNAPYVITDLVHLAGAIRAGATDGEVFAVLAPVYGAFVLAGVAGYAASVDMASRYVRRERDAISARLTEVAFHALCSVGVYLGRVHRLTSWEVVSNPMRVSAAVADLARPTIVAGLIVFTTTLVMITAVARTVATAAWQLSEPLLRRAG